jgi:hypothetical protein
VVFFAVLVCFSSVVSAASTLSWNTSADWDNAVSESRVVHEYVANTDYSDAGVLRKGYSYSDPVSDSSLASYWPLDQDSSSSAEEVKGGDDGDLKNGVTQASAGILGTDAYRFDGQDDYVVLPASAFPDSDNTISWGGWAYLDSDASNSCCLNFIGDISSDGDDLDLKYHIDSQEWEVRIDGNSRFFVSADVIGKWSHVMATYDGSETRLYVNGELKGSTSYSSGIDLGRHRLGSGVDRRYWDGKLDEVRVYDSALSSSEVQSIYEKSTLDGSLTTDWKYFDSERDNSSIEIRDTVSDTSSGSIKVYVESDTDGDGVVDETSDPISLDGSGGPYSVGGLKNDSGRFRLDVRLSNSDVTATPTLSSVNLTAESAGPSICDSRGPKNECISDKEHDISSESFTISSIFEVERSAVFNAVNGLAFIEVGNSSSLSGTWKGSFNISTPEETPAVIAPGAHFQPGSENILID